MNALLALSRLIDAINRPLGKLMYWLILASILISALNACLRYAFNISSNGMLEIQWYLFGVVFLFASSLTLMENGHVRVDFFSSKLSPKGQAWLDVFGTLFMLLPMCVIVTYYAWPMAMNSLEIREMSSDPGGLVRWPIKLVIPFAFGLLGLQGISEMIKKLAFIAGHPDYQPQTQGH